VPTAENFLNNLPDDKETLKAMLRSLWQERERQEQRAEEQRRRADELYLETLRLPDMSRSGHFQMSGCATSKV